MLSTTTKTKERLGHFATFEKVHIGHVIYGLFWNLCKELSECGAFDKVIKLKDKTHIKLSEQLQHLKRRELKM